MRGQGGGNPGTPVWSLLYAPSHTAGQHAPTPLPALPAGQRCGVRRAGAVLRGRGGWPRHPGDLPLQASASGRLHLTLPHDCHQVERLLHMQVRHECLARLRCVLRCATAVKAVTPDCEVAILLNVPAVVSDFYTNGDLFDALFKPQMGGKLAAPRAMPEAIARNYMWQIVTVRLHP